MATAGWFVMKLGRQAVRTQFLLKNLSEDVLTTTSRVFDFEILGHSGEVD